MIFESITLENLFSYCGAHTFDLAGTSEGRNIVLISGRNGFGKTSFLNALKLLFGGVTENLRRAVQRERTPSDKQYVIGAGEDWWGLLNRRARQNRQKHCAVRAVWREDAGRVQVERVWEIGANSYETRLRIEADFLEQPLEDTAAQEFLDFRLPAEFIKFFIFDGEQIQEIAEANRDEQVRQIEALLNIGKLGLLREALKAANQHWQEAAMDTRRAADLEDLKARLAKTQADQAATALALQLAEEELGLLENEISVLKRRQEGRRASVNQLSEALLKERITQAENEHTSLSAKLADALPRIAPLLLSAELADKGMQLLDRQLKQSNGPAPLLRRLAEVLPGQVFDTPPLPPTLPLQASQDSFYRNRLRKLLEAEVGDDLPPRSQIDRPKVEKAKSVLQRYAYNDDARRHFAEMLSRLWTLESQRKKLEQERRDATSESQAEREAYAKAEAELEALGNKLLDLKLLIKERRNESERLSKLAQDQTVQIDQQRHSVALSEQARQRLQVSNRLSRFLDAYKQRLKESSRKELEDALNLRYSQLMTSNTLVRRIAVDEFFALHYLNLEGETVGMGNLSAGTKQIAATALLWALKDCSGKQLPVIVDTPLARIDRGNQERLLTAYYPHASQQVIVLPTDSELDEEKYRLIQPHVYREFVLHNPSGSETEILHQPMYPARKVRHG